MAREGLLNRPVTPTPSAETSPAPSAVDSTQVDAPRPQRRHDDAALRTDEAGLPQQWSGTALNKPVPTLVRRRSSDEWARPYRLFLIGLDLVAGLAAGLGAVLLRYGNIGDYGFVQYRLVVTLFPIAWVVSIALARGYEARYLGLGADEFKRVVSGGVSLTAAVSFIAFTAKLPLSRAFVGIALPGATLLTLLGRYAARRVLHRLRRQGRASHKVLVVGNLNDVVDLVNAVRREPQAGLVPVGACLTRRSGRLDLPGPPLPVLGGLSDVLLAVDNLEVDMVAVCGSRGVSSDGLRRLAWELEGTGVGLVVAPALTDVAGPRVHIRPVAGLPLLHVEEPVFRGAGHLLKSTFDRLAAVLGLLALSPLLLIVAALVRFNSPGGVFFRQERIGRNGEPFWVWKFRSMYADAETRRVDMVDQNETDGLLFKIRADPRITPIGRWLRRYSVDELPQLINVLVGDMSLVGPRPPLPSEVERYESDVKRRLLVRPGITGLWQISGRSDLAWEDAVRLDLYYVDNWSLVFDFMILWKTLFAVIRGNGAY